MKLAAAFRRRTLRNASGKKRLGKIQVYFPKQHSPRPHDSSHSTKPGEASQSLDSASVSRLSFPGPGPSPLYSVWVWLKIKQQGQTAGFGPCFHLPGQAIHLATCDFQGTPAENSDTGRGDPVERALPRLFASGSSGGGSWSVSHHFGR